MLDRFHKISEIVAAFAIVGSLIFVGLQLNQNTEALEHSATQANATNWQDILLTMATNEGLQDTWLRTLSVKGDFESLETDRDTIRMVFFVQALMRSLEFDYHQWLDGNLSDERWATTRSGLLNVLAIQPGVREVWVNTRNVNFSPTFSAMVDEVVLEAEAMVANMSIPPS